MLKLVLPLSLMMMNNKPRAMQLSPMIYMLFTLLLMNMLPLYTFTQLNLMIWVTQTINIMLSSLTMWISALMIMASWKFVLMKKEENMLMMYINMLLMILLFAFSTNNIIMFYILFEASLIPTFMIILGWGYQPERLEATNYLMIYTIFASLPLLLSILMMTNCTGSMSIIIKSEKFISVNSYWWIIIIMAFLVKTPMYLTHLWLPKAHVEAPVAGSMSLAAMLLKLGSYGLIIISKYNMMVNNKVIFMVSSLSLWGALISGLICIRQTDLKSLIAYSSISHMALVTASILTNNLWGWSGAFILMLAHGLCSSSMFNYANMVTDMSSSRSMYLNKGMMALTPSITMWWFLMSAINMGAPPSINLMSEIMMMISIMSSTMYLMLYLALVSFMTAAYNLMMYTSTSHGNKMMFLLPSNNMNHRSYLINFMHIIPLLGLISSPKFISLFI